MFTFRSKILISYILVFFVFMSLMCPFASRMVKNITKTAMEDRATAIIAKIQSAPNNDALIRRLKTLKSQMFFRISVITNERKILYDSHTKRLLGPRFSQEYIVNHPEVLSAFRDGMGYNEDYSDLLQQKFAYMAKSFNFHGKTYVIRTAFPYQYLTDLSDDFEFGFLALGTAFLLLFSIMTWFIINHLTRPIQQIIDIVRPYQEGKVNALPEVSGVSASPQDDFGRLAQTLNSMSSKIQSHIDSLTVERNEKEVLLESLGEGVVAVDSEMVVTYANWMAQKFLGQSIDELLGQPLSQTVHPKCYELLEMCQKKNQPLNGTLTLHVDDEKLHLDLIAVPKKAASGAVLVLQDKTSHYRILEMRKDFVANASHELKTPITIIRGFAETLHENPSFSREMTETITSKIVNSCKRMTTLIKDLLALTDIEHIPTSRLIECDLYALIEECCYLISDAFPDAKISLNKPEGENVLLTADPNLMEMALTNIIENAAKYSSGTPEITITLENLPGKVKIEIQDKGIGIPKEKLPHIFERFYTVNKQHSKKLGGSGLGLSIVNTIVDKHFGRIIVDSVEGEGTIFTLLFPLR